MCDSHKQVCVLNRRRKPSAGFSLIELLIVIAIISIIVTIGIPILMSARQRAMNEKARQSIRHVVTAQNAYFAAIGSYGQLDALATIDPPYLDARFASGTGLLGNGIEISIDLGGDGLSFDVTAENPGGTSDFTASEDGRIVEVPH